MEIHIFSNSANASFDLNNDDALKEAKVMIKGISLYEIILAKICFMYWL